MNLKTTLTILAGFVCAVMTASAFSADGSINLDGGEVNNVPSSKSTVIGNQNTVLQDNSVVIGQQNETKQYNTSEKHPRIIIGDKNQANAGAIILGEGGVADEQSVVVGGDASKALGVAVGNGAKGGYNAVSVGLGATTEKASFGVAVGAESAALSSGPQGQGSVAVGTRATAGYGGVALGYGAYATNGGVALGTGSLTARFDEVNVGERFISGVKAGTSKTDAANVGQVQVSNANTLAVANAHSDTGNADTLRAARSHTDERETATNARTDALLKVEQTARNEAIANESLARRDGDAATLKSANDYTNWRVGTLNIDTADTLRQSQTYTDTRANEARYYTDNKFSQLNTRIERAETRLHAGIAGVAAIASIPYVASNRFSYGVAVGNYQSANALAGGIQYKTSPNTTIRLNVSLDSSHNAALAVGVGGGW